MRKKRNSLQKKSAAHPLKLHDYFRITQACLRDVQPVLVEIGVISLLTGHILGVIIIEIGKLSST